MIPLYIERSPFADEFTKIALGALAKVISGGLRTGAKAGGKAMSTGAQMARTVAPSRAGRMVSGVRVKPPPAPVRAPKVAPSLQARPTPTATHRGFDIRTGRPMPAAGPRAVTKTQPAPVPRSGPAAPSAPAGTRAAQQQTQWSGQRGQDVMRGTVNPDVAGSAAHRAAVAQSGQYYRGVGQPVQEALAASPLVRAGMPAQQANLLALSSLPAGTASSKMPGTMLEMIRGKGPPSASMATKISSAAFMDELVKIARGAHAARKGRRPMFVSTMLKKQKEGTLTKFTKAAQVPSDQSTLEFKESDEPWKTGRSAKAKRKPGDVPTKEGDSAYPKAEERQTQQATVLADSLNQADSIPKSGWAQPKGGHANLHQPEQKSRYSNLISAVQLEDISPAIHPDERSTT